MVTHAVIHLMYGYPQIAESLQELNFEFSELTQAVTSHEPMYITGQLKIYMYA